ncbi:MAG: hypothetical protein ACREOH_02290, partial [Candidatus Entotheonellia bacterium]
NAGIQDAVHATAIRSNAGQGASAWSMVGEILEGNLSVASCSSWIGSRDNTRTIDAHKGE